MREVARSAGVSHQAPYHYFADRSDILAELVRQGFEELSAAMTEAMAASRRPEDALSACGAAYTGFAFAHPALFRLMFRSDAVDIGRYPSVRATAENAFAILVSAVAGMMPAETPGFSEKIIGSWALAHGLASLAIDGKFAARMGDGFRPGSPALDDLIAATLGEHSATLWRARPVPEPPSAPCPGDGDDLSGQKP
jgi:AcrR family transcriptional regulator